MNQGILILHPENAASHPGLQKVSHLLLEHGLIGDPIDGMQQGFYAGDHFLQLITFMGCSPHIRFEPVDRQDRGYCYITLSSSHTPRLRVSEHARPPRCSRCNKPVDKKWQAEAARQRLISCPHCHLQQLPEQLGWRNDAGMGCFFIEIHNIFPGEAQPVPRLLQLLHAIDAEPWRYCYLHNLK